MTSIHDCVHASINDLVTDALVHRVVLILIRHVVWRGRTGVDVQETAIFRLYHDTSNLTADPSEPVDAAFALACVYACVRVCIGTDVPS